MLRFMKMRQDMMELINRKTRHSDEHEHSVEDSVDFSKPEIDLKSNVRDDTDDDDGDAKVNGESEIPLFVLGLVVLCSSLENADETILPASYAAVGKDLGVSLTALASLTFGRSLIQAVACPFIAPLSDRFASLWVIGCSSIGWGIATVIIAFSSSYNTLLVFRAVTGVALSFCVPALRSFLSYVSSSKRARGYGLLQFGSNLGGIFGAAFATLIGNKEFELGGFACRGWRITFFVFGVISILLGLVVCSVHLRNPNIIPETKIHRSLTNYYRTLGQIIKKPTFIGIILQGIIGCMPWKSFAFLTVMLQRAGFSDPSAAFTVGVFNIGCTCGTLVGGFIGDYLNNLNPDKGYIMTAQLSVASQLPLSYICLKAIPHRMENFYPLNAAFFAFGLFITWCAAANSCILTDICPKVNRNAIFALNYGIQGSISSAAVPIVAMLSNAGDETSHEIDPLTENVFRLCAFASVYMFVIYSSLPQYYLADREKVSYQSVNSQETK